MWRSVPTTRALTLWSSSAALAATDTESGAAKAAVCAGCHGPEGISVNPLWPNLTGQHADYLEKQVKAFRDGVRVDPTMQPFVTTLSDAEVTDIAKFFASHKACKLRDVPSFAAPPIRSAPRRPI